MTPLDFAVKLWLAAAGCLKGLIDEWQRNKALTEAVLDAAERDWLEGTKDTRRALHIAVHARREARS